MQPLTPPLPSSPQQPTGFSPYFQSSSPPFLYPYGPQPTNSPFYPQKKGPNKILILIILVVVGIAILAIVGTAVGLYFGLRKKTSKSPSSPNGGSGNSPSSPSNGTGTTSSPADNGGSTTISPVGRKVRVAIIFDFSNVGMDSKFKSQATKFLNGKDRVYINLLKDNFYGFLSVTTNQSDASVFTYTSESKLMTNDNQRCVSSGPKDARGDFLIIFTDCKNSDKHVLQNNNLINQTLNRTFSCEFYDNNSEYGLVFYPENEMPGVRTIFEYV